MWFGAEVPLASALILWAGIVLAGVFIGATGIGGVALVPLLTLWGGFTIQTAVPVSLLSFLFTGTVGLIMHRRHNSLAPRALLLLMVCTGIGALFGAALFPFLPRGVIEPLVLSVLLLGTLAAWRPPSASGAREPSARFMIGAAGFTGLGSVITGTGGPAILMPILFWVQAPVLLAIAAGQAALLPVALFGSLGHVITGTVHWPAVASVGGLTGAGAIAGARLARRVPPHQLRRAIAVLLTVLAGIYALRVAGEI